MSETEYDELKQMARCVHLYFREQKHQREIGKLLGISASTVSRLVKKAYDEGWVNVDFSLPALPGLAAELIESFNLRDAVVIPTGEPSEVKRDLGASGARYFERTVGESVSVGISCGLTLYYLVQNLREGRLRHLKIYPLSTEVRLRSVDLFPNTLVGIMAAKYRPYVSGFALPAPDGRVAEGTQKPEEAFRDIGAQEIFLAAHEVDVALIGIGGIDSNSPGFSAIAKESGMDIDLKSIGAVAEYNYQLIDKRGDEINERQLRQVRKKIAAVPIARLREMARTHGKTVIAIAGGNQKIEAIRAVLTGRLCNVLITDSSVASELNRVD